MGNKEYRFQQEDIVWTTLVNFSLTRVAVASIYLNNGKISPIMLVLGNLPDPVLWFFICTTRGPVCNQSFWHTLFSFWNAELLED